MTGVLRSTTRRSLCPIVGILSLLCIGLIVFYTYKVRDVKILFSNINVTVIVAPACSGVWRSDGDDAILNYCFS